MENSEDITIILFIRGLKHYLGICVDNAYRNAKREYYSSLKGELYCGICGIKMSWKEPRSLDHIIPKSVIYETGLVGLIFDHRNFRATHVECNVGRGALTINDMPDKVRDKLFVFANNTNTP